MIRILTLVLVVVVAGIANAFVPSISGTGMLARQGTVLHESIVDQVTLEMKTAMKAKDLVTLQTVRLIRSAFANAAIEERVDVTMLSDEQAQSVLRKLSKMRQESIDMYSSNGATDRADMERAELLVIERWLPALADEEQTRVWVQEVIGQIGVGNPGKVMGALMKLHKADLDGSLTQRIVKEEMAVANATTKNDTTQ